MFEPLPKLGNFQTMQVWVWQTAGEGGFATFYSQLNQKQPRCAVHTREHLIRIQERGEDALHTSEQVEAETPLRLLYCGAVWLIFATAHQECYLCNYGLNRYSRADVRSAHDRINRFLHCTLSYEK